MKVLSLSLILLSVLSCFTEAQEKKKIEVGPTFGINIAMNTADYHVSDAQRSITPGFVAGVNADIQVGNNLSLLVGLGYQSVSFSDENSHVDRDYPRDQDVKLGSLLTTEGTFSYMFFAPALKFGEAFFVGFNFGLPVSAEITNSMSGGLPGYLRADISPADDERKLLIEGRLGGMFSVMSNEQGSLRVALTASYPLTEAATSPTDNSKLPRLDDNFRMPNILFSVSYLFAI